MSFVLGTICLAILPVIVTSSPEASPKVTSPLSVVAPEAVSVVKLPALPAEPSAFATSTIVPPLFT